MPTICPNWQHPTRMRALIVEDEPLIAEAVRDGLRLEAIAADVAGVGYRIDTQPDTGPEGGDRG